ncbi:hypothetical protein Lal_00033831 [Lupinus albus]|nr:hypothetical protein Lal_00033831 [Lupinus albus]
MKSHTHANILHMIHNSLIHHMIDPPHILSDPQLLSAATSAYCRHRCRHREKKKVKEKKMWVDNDNISIMKVKRGEKMVGIKKNFLSANTTQDDHAPLWAYVTISDKAKDEGGNKSWTCNFYNKSFKSSYSRVKAHLLRIHKGGMSGCSKLVVDLSENKIKPKHVPLTTEDRDHLKALIARMFYSSGLPFNLARNHYYVNSYLFAANHNHSGFLPPRYDALRTSILQQEKTNVERLLKPIKSTWKPKGVSIISDG